MEIHLRNLDRFRYSNAGGLWGGVMEIFGMGGDQKKQAIEQGANIAAQDIAERKTADKIFEAQNQAEIDIKLAKSDLKNKSREAEIDGMDANNELLRMRTKMEAQGLGVQYDTAEMLGAVAAKKALGQADLEKKDLESAIQMRMVYAGGGILLALILIVMFFKSSKNEK